MTYAARTTIAREAIIEYLQEKLDEFMESKREFGMDRETVRRFDEMIACKEMAEVLIGEPVNIRKDGKITIGF